MVIRCVISEVSKSGVKTTKIECLIWDDKVTSCLFWNGLMLATLPAPLWASSISSHFNSMIEPFSDSLNLQRERTPMEQPSGALLGLHQRRLTSRSHAMHEVSEVGRTYHVTDANLSFPVSYTARTQFSPRPDLKRYGLDIPVFIGVSSDARFQQLETWLYARGAGGQKFFTVNCTVQSDVIRGVIECHQAVADSALHYFGGRPGMYIDLEDNAHPTLRIDWQTAYDAALALHGHPEWRFVHLSRFPFPFGLFDPHCPLTGSLYFKPWTFNELAQAMLCTTEFATWISRELSFDEPYDDMLMPWQRYVVYPSLFQRWTEEMLATHATSIFGNGSPLQVLRNIAFQPTIYLMIEVLNVSGFWLLLSSIIACIPCFLESHHRFCYRCRKTSRHRT